MPTSSTSAIVIEPFHANSSRPFYVRTGTFDQHIVRWVYTQDEYGLRRMSAAGSRPRRILDIGAHIGSFSRLATECFPDANLIAVEAHPENFWLLQKNLAHVEVLHLLHHVVIGDYEQDGGSERLVDLTLEQNTGGWGPWTPGKSRLSTVTLADLCDMFGVGDIDLLKLDCEGSEYMILDHSPKDVLRRIQTIVCELHGPEEQRLRLLQSMSETHKVVEYTAGNPHYDIAGARFERKP